jgi:hypothetical protein
MRPPSASAMVSGFLGGEGQVGGARSAPPSSLKMNSRLPKRAIVSGVRTTQGPLRALMVASRLMGGRGRAFGAPTLSSSPLRTKLRFSKRIVASGIQTASRLAIWSIECSSRMHKPPT